MFASTEHRQRVIEGGNIEHAIQVSARKHFLDKVTRIHKLQLNAVGFSPVMQRQKQTQTAGIERLHIREVEHDCASGLL
jgi:hypothetical protein